ncbi:MAG: hypothetical protein K6B52_01090 [Clostridiales bacterium]|nr:hypothetical protein [Clostridiales bacterium]
MKKKIIAVILTLCLMISFCVPVFALGIKGSGYSVISHIVDKALGVAHDAIFFVAQTITKERNIPSVDEYKNETHDYIYDGTNGLSRGNGWSAGFGSHSVIPASWRCDAEGKADPNGMCLNCKKATGGYQTKVSKIYTDQLLNLVILSNGSDKNDNGINDIIIFASVEGVGVTAGTVKDMRSSIEEALKEKGVSHDDILGINISSTHCHAGLDTQGMCITTLFNNKLNPFTDYIRSLSEEMENTLAFAASEAAKDAFGKIEGGTLSFFKTDKVDGARDKLNSGANTVNKFSCLLFEGRNEKTIISNIGAHPVSYGAWDNKQMMCTDYPGFMALALKDAGYNLVFTQSSQACVSSPGIDADADEIVTDWIESKALSKQDWIDRYGKKYADKWYDDLEDSLEGHMENAAKLAYHILKFIDKAEPVAPTLKVKNTETLISLDYGVMALGSTSGLLGENVVKYKGTETGYGLFVETDYIEFGEKISIITAPGELSPALTFGTDPDYDGSALWTGEQSWSGEEWKYDTFENMIRQSTGDEDRIVLCFGITNDALGYMYPDTMPTQSIIAPLLFYKGGPDDMSNCMLMTVSTKIGSELAEAYSVIAE